MKEQIEIAGMVDRITTVLRDKDGNIKSRRILNNSKVHRLLRKLGLRHDSFTSAGMAVIAGLTIGTGTAFTYMAIGTGTQASTVADDATWNHACQTEKKRKVCSDGNLTRVQTNYSNDTAEWIAVFSNALDGLTGTDSICEIVIANNATAGSGTILLRQVYSPADSCNWTQGDTLTVTCTFQQKQGT